MQSISGGSTEEHHRPVGFSIGRTRIMQEGYPRAGERVKGMKVEDGGAGIAEVAEEKPGGAAGLATERGSDSTAPLAGDT